MPSSALLSNRINPFSRRCIRKLVRMIRYTVSFVSDREQPAWWLCQFLSHGDLPDHIETYFPESNYQYPNISKGGTSGRAGSQRMSQRSAQDDPRQPMSLGG